MTDADAIERRLSAVERAVSGDDIPDGATVEGADGRVADIDDRLADLEEAVTDLEAATQALRGYVGNVRSVNRDVERRAEAALAAVDRLEARFEETAGVDGPRRDGRRSAGTDVGEWAGDGTDDVAPERASGTTGRMDADAPDAADGTAGPTGDSVSNAVAGTAGQADAHGARPATEMAVPGAVEGGEGTARERRNSTGNARRGASADTGSDGGVFARVRDAL